MALALQTVATQTEYEGGIFLREKNLNTWLVPQGGGPLYMNTVHGARCYERQCRLPKGSSSRAGRSIALLRPKGSKWQLIGFTGDHPPWDESPKAKAEQHHTMRPLYHERERVRERESV